MFTSTELRQKFLDFFVSKGHVIVPSSSLVPENDPSVLLTTAGMQQFKSYFTGSADPLKDNHLSSGKPLGSSDVASIQKCFRTSDIEEVGDDTHLTFFQMLGHFSFGDYFKKETIDWTYELLTKEFQISPDRIRVTVFGGDESVSFDEESFNTWSKLLPVEKIGKGPRVDNFWGPAGSEGVCGACNEVYVDDVEVATLVFMEYYCKPDGSLDKLKQKGVDVGWGFERLVVKQQKLGNVFESDLFSEVIAELPSEFDKKDKRILADHLRAICFLISDGVRPSNKEAGYILRRLMRRVMVYEKVNFEQILSVIIRQYSDFYDGLNNDLVVGEFKSELVKFNKALDEGLKIALKRIGQGEKLQDVAFDLFNTYGLPVEVLLKKVNTLEVFTKEKVRVDEDLIMREFNERLKKHQALSKTASAGMFKGGLVDNEPQTIKHHTAHHLLLAALRQVLGSHVLQRGSNVSSERLRIDFSHSEKVTPEQLKQVEEIVNKVIAEDLEVRREEMPKVEAEKLGAMAEFGAKYSDIVSVYTILNKDGSVFSREFCGGPHVTHTGEIRDFKIIKEESVAAGIRRIKAKIYPHT